MFVQVAFAPPDQQHGDDRKGGDQRGQQRHGGEHKADEVT